MGPRLLLQMKIKGYSFVRTELNKGESTIGGHYKRLCMRVNWGQTTGDVAKKKN